MDHLSKQQVILLAILISFVTSLATGIVTVSLMDQAPQSVARTITQVIQQTVAAAVPVGASSTAAVSIAVNDQVADATDTVTPSIVRLRDGDRGEFVGLGLIVSKSGSIMADKNLIDTLNIPQAVFPNGIAVPVSISRFQLEGDIAFLTPIRSLPFQPRAISFGSGSRLGTTMWSLTGTSTYTLSQGIVVELEAVPGTTHQIIHTSIPSSKAITGAPLFDAYGNVVGMTTRSLSRDTNSAYYPVESARDGIPR